MLGTPPELCQSCNKCFDQKYLPVGTTRTAVARFDQPGSGPSRFDHGRHIVAAPCSWSRRATPGTVPHAGVFVRGTKTGPEFVSHMRTVGTGRGLGRVPH
jgi:hypothetical protein